MGRLRRTTAVGGLVVSLAVCLASAQGRPEQDTRTHLGPLGLFAVECPASWREVVFHEPDSLTSLLTPQAGVAAPDAFTTGFKVELTPLADSDAIRRTPMLDYARQRLDSLVSFYTRYGLAPLEGEAGEPRALKVAGRDAVRQDFEATFLGTPCRVRIVQFAADDLQYFVECIAPANEFATLEATFARMLETFRPLPERRELSRGGVPRPREELVTRLRASVVRVVATFPGGSVQSGAGVVVRADGLILTTYRVVHRDGLAALRIRVSQDRESGPGRTSDAELVDALLRERPRTDLALLRAKGKTRGVLNRPAPLGPLASGTVHAGDEVVMFSPSGEENLLAADRLQLFEGRVVPASSGSPVPVRDLTLQTKGGAGIDGSPCVSLRTGAVIGLVSRYGVADGGPAGLCAIDRAVARFPQLRVNPSGSLMAPAEHLELSRWLSNAGRERAARIELALAARGEPGFDARTRAFYRYQRAALRPPATTTDQQIAMLQAVLESDPDYANAYFDLAYLHAARSEAEPALASVDKGAARSPAWWGRFYHAASVSRSLRRHDDAQKAIGEAKKRGGTFHPALHRLEGLVAWESGRHDDAERAFRRALEADPADYASRLLLAQLNQYPPRNDRVAAEAELNRALEDYPAEPAVHERYARFLRDGKKRPDLVDRHAREAVRLASERGAPPAPSALELFALAALDRKDPADHARALAAALALHRQGPDQAQRAHALLHRYWSTTGNAALARAHAYLGGERLRPKSGAPPAITEKDFRAAERAGYDGALFRETMEVVSLDFDTEEAFGIGDLLGFGLPVEHLTAARARSRTDQMTGSRALAALLVPKFQWNAGRRGPEISKGSFTSKAHVPLTGVTVAVVYMDGQKKTLWRQKVNLPEAFLPVEPQAWSLFDLDLPDWKELAPYGVSAQNLAFVSLGFTNARNAVFLRDLVPTAGKRTPSGYSFRIENRSEFTVSNPLVKVSYFDEKKEPILATAKGAGRRFPSLSIPPGKTSGEVVVKEWVDPAYLKKALFTYQGGAIYLQLNVTAADLR